MTGIVSSGSNDPPTLATTMSRPPSVTPASSLSAPTPAPADASSPVRAPVSRLPGVQRFTTTMVTRAIKAHAPLMAVVDD